MNWMMPPKWKQIFIIIKCSRLNWSHSRISWKSIHGINDKLLMTDQLFLEHESEGSLSNFCNSVKTGMPWNLIIEWLQVLWHKTRLQEGLSVKFTSLIYVFVYNYNSQFSWSHFKFVSLPVGFLNFWIVNSNQRNATEIFEMCWCEFDHLSFKHCLKFISICMSDNLSTRTLIRTLLAKGNVGHFNENSWLKFKDKKNSFQFIWSENVHNMSKIKSGTWYNRA